MSAAPLLIGHSHVHAPLFAARALGLDIDAVPLWEDAGVVQDVGGELRFRSDVLEKICRRGPVYSFFGGSAHSALSLWEHQRPFDFVLPWDSGTPLEPDREHVPVAAVRQTLELLGARHDRMLCMLARHARGPVVHFGPPPPVGDTHSILKEQLRKRPSAAAASKPSQEGAGGALQIRVPAGTAKGFSPPWLRLKVWRLEVATIAARCESLGISFRAAPAAATDALGFLKPEYVADLVHANAAYGKLLLRSWGYAV